MNTIRLLQIKQTLWNQIFGIKLAYTTRAAEFACTRSNNRNLYNRKSNEKVRGNSMKQKSTAYINPSGVNVI